MIVGASQIELSATVRRHWHVTGQVQGVGFRPFVYRLAADLCLSGFVGNDAAGVFIEAQGSRATLDRFLERLVQERPELAVITAIESTPVAVRKGERGFAIEPSTAPDLPGADVTVDAALCPDCLREMLDTADRRAGYGLINCTNCGPRYTIIRRVPYDRPNTTMADFAMCPDCRREYQNPADRRFHAQPTACPRCGPQVQLVDSLGNPQTGDLIAMTVERLMGGQILAIKGLGGFHLACRARDDDAVARLRRLKHRDQKPFAVMCADLAGAREIVELSPAAETALASPQCPIVLAPRRAEAAVALEVAPGNHRIGVMLPYTPIQHLLFRRGKGLGPLVMTSGNLTDEPLVTENTQAVQRLGGLCDAILWHQRPIQRPVDDSVLLDLGDAGLQPIRRARGYVPTALPLPEGGRTMGLCVGAELKSTVTVVRRGDAILSHHLGDLTHALTYDAFQRATEDMCDLFSVRPRWIAHDLHPAYLSTRWAREMAGKWGVPLVGVQHHHAHAASVLAEHGRTGPALAVVCDGVGYGADGTSWGGELLAADLNGFTRLAHLRPLRLPGGDAAARDTRRCGLALLYQAFGDDFAQHPATARLVSDPSEREFLCRMIADDVRCATSSSTGRLFDGVAALLGVCLRNSFEAQAAMRLESLAFGEPARPDDLDLFAIDHPAGSEARTIDLTPLIRELVVPVQAGERLSARAARFHDQLARAWEAVVVDAARKTGLNAVVLSGGAFCNQRLTCELSRRLEARGLAVLRHRRVPANDGGISYGQAAVAAFRLSRAADDGGV